MRPAAVVLMLATFACKSGSDGSEPGSRALYDLCDYGLPPEQELCGEGLVCQGSLDPKASYCAPACSTPSEDIYTQDPQCPEIEGFVSYCVDSANAPSCVIVCDTTCPDGLGLQCPESSNFCEGRDDP